MQGVLYEEPTIWLFLLVTMALGGWLARMSDGPPPSGNELDA